VRFLSIEAHAKAQRTQRGKPQPNHGRAVLRRRPNFRVLSGKILAQLREFDRLQCKAENRTKLHFAHSARIGAEHGEKTERN